MKQLKGALDTIVARLNDLESRSSLFLYNTTLVQISTGFDTTSTTFVTYHSLDYMSSCANATLHVTVHFSGGSLAYSGFTSDTEVHVRLVSGATILRGPFTLFASTGTSAAVTLGGGTLSYRGMYSNSNSIPVNFALQLARSGGSLRAALYSADFRIDEFCPSF
jgi:hypothetical protein